MILEELNAELYKAQKERDMFKLGSLRYVMSKIKNKQIELRVEGLELDDSHVLAIIKKQIKERNQSIEGYKKVGREEAVAKEEAELALMQSYYDRFSQSDN